MLYSNIGALKSSKIVIGTDYYGQTLSKSTAHSLLDLFVDHGGNHIDTARIYGAGNSESVIGEWLKTRRRDSVIIASKGAHPDPKTMHIPRLSLAEIESDLNESLSRLETDYIDLYWLHRDCTDISAGEIIESMNTLVKKGKIRFFGASNWHAWRIAEANQYAANHSLMGFTASQIKYSVGITAPSFADDPTLVEMNDSEYPFYKNSQIPVMAYASQSKGFFSKLFQGGVTALSDKARERYLCDENLRRFEAIKALSEKHQKPIAAIVCAALTSITDFDVFPIIGGKSKEQLTESLEGSDFLLSRQELKTIFETI